MTTRSTTPSTPEPSDDRRRLDRATSTGDGYAVNGAREILLEEGTRARNSAA